MLRRAAFLVSLWSAAAIAAPIFNFVETTSMTDEVRAGFQAAADQWSSVLNDDVTITIEIGFADLAAGVLGQSSTEMGTAPYASVRALLGLDATSPDDAGANASLGAGPLVALMNYSTEHPGATRVSDNNGSDNNNYLRFSTANARALGFTVLAGTDAAITFNTDFAFDFNPGDGITAGQYDFVGVATHEIGHALGFTSGVDRRDRYPDQDSEDDPRLWASVLDLYRYSASGTRDWGVGGTPYFSIDGGATSLYLFSTGRLHGDGRQASHWKAGGPAIMDPTFADGELGQITALDLQALDVIGWDLTAYAVPEPSGVALAASGLLAAILLRCRLRGGRLAG